jgi:hypothetical protein
MLLKAWWPKFSVPPAAVTSSRFYCAVLWSAFSAPGLGISEVAASRSMVTVCRLVVEAAGPAFTHATAAAGGING